MNTGKQILYVLGGLALLGLLWFAYYAISPLFINIKVDEALPTSMQEEQMSQTIPTEQGEASVQTTSQTETPPPLPIVRAQIIDTPAHPASGFVRLVEVDGKTYVRYEDYKTINGPDIYVYLAKDIDAKEFVDLGRVRATEGNINYEVPANIDTSEYRYVLTWCKQFGVLFNYADLKKS